MGNYDSTTLTGGCAVLKTTIKQSQLDDLYGGGAPAKYWNPSFKNRDTTQFNTPSEVKKIILGEYSS